ncbi:MAG: hypothetical protein KJ882_03915 [Proteobacteria bacterium]|nr:hypothetical protein [bacterium]MBU4009889.1 hypothetical protein [Pseudomonadota bacterium]
MAIETERINITIEKGLALELKKFTSPRKRSAFITDAIKRKIAQQKKEELETKLKEGYTARNSEGLNITGEYEALDMENWDEY